MEVLSEVVLATRPQIQIGLLFYQLLGNGAPVVLFLFDLLAEFIVVAVRHGILPLSFMGYNVELLGLVRFQGIKEP